MVSQNLTYSEVQKAYPEAWEALAEPYKNDSCLIFFLDCNGNLCAEHDIGNEEFVYVPEKKVWESLTGMYRL